MSKMMKLNIIHTAVWSAVAIGLIIIFCLPGTISQWGNSRIKIVLLAALFLIGFVTDFILRILEKSQKRGFERDERDDKVQADAVFKSFAAVLLYVFSVSIILYIKYENAGFLPVGWMWFVSYSTVVAANWLVGMFSLIEYKKQGL